MPEDSTAFSSLEPHPRSKEGINGSLTPARRQRRLSYDRSPLAFQKIADDQKRDNATAYPSIADQNPLPERRGSRGYGSLDANSGPRLAGGEGISLQETEARIHELERSEFDLKMRLFYAEEQLEDAAGRADAVQLHREVADAKRRRAHAEDRTRQAQEALAGIEVNCKNLQAKVRDAEARRKKDQEMRAQVEDEAASRLKKHISLLEETLRAERVENTRLRIVAAGRRVVDDEPTAGSRVKHAMLRRRSTGDDIGNPNPWSSGRGSGGGGFGPKKREQESLLVAKVGAQDSSMRLLRADVTTLRRRLRAQGEVLAKQREENEVVRLAAEQVACVEAEEIARLTKELEQAVSTAKREAERRRAAEQRLATLDTRLLSLKTNGRRTPRSGSRTPSPHPHGRSNDARAPANGTGWAHGKRLCPRDCSSSPSSAWGDSGSRERETMSLPPPKRVMDSTISSRGRRLTEDGTATRRERGRGHGKGHSSPSPRRSRGFEQQHWRPPGRSPPPSPQDGGRDGRDGGAASGGAAAASGHPRPHRRRQSGEVGPVRGLTKSSSLGFFNESVKNGGGGGDNGGGRGGGNVGGRGREPSSRLVKGRLGRGERGASPLHYGGGWSGRSSLGRRSSEDFRGVAGGLGGPSRPARGDSDGGGRSAAGAGRLSRTAVSSRASKSNAVTAEEDVKKHAAVRGASSKRPPERRSGVALQGQGGDASGGTRVSTPADGFLSGEMSAAGAFAAAIRDVDFSETVARELRLAVATTAAPAPAAAAPPVSRATRGAGWDFAETKARKQTPVDGAGARDETAAPVNEDKWGSDAPESWEKGGTPGRHRRGKSDSLYSNGRGLGTPAGDGGRGLKSREVVELENDVQHIFQFFVARDRAGSVGAGGGGGGTEGKGKGYVSAMAGALP